MKCVEKFYTHAGILHIICIACTVFAAGSMKRSGVRQSDCQYHRQTAASAWCWFAAERGRLQQMSIDSCRCPRSGSKSVMLTVEGRGSTQTCVKTKRQHNVANQPEEDWATATDNIHWNFGKVLSSGGMPADRNSVAVFKLRLKTFLFSQAFSSFSAH